MHTAMAMVCACLPIFGPLVRKIKKSPLGRWVSARHRTRMPTAPTESAPRGPSWSKIELSWPSSRLDNPKPEKKAIQGQIRKWFGPAERDLPAYVVQPLEAVHLPSSAKSDPSPVSDPTEWRLTVFQGQGGANVELLPGIRQEMLQRGFDLDAERGICNQLR